MKAIAVHKLLVRADFIPDATKRRLDYLYKERAPDDELLRVDLQKGDSVFLKIVCMLPGVQATASHGRSLLGTTQSMVDIAFCTA